MSSCKLETTRHTRLQRLQEEISRESCAKDDVTAREKDATGITQE
jgi:hypothetical protein